jgi:hypothetical protein
MADNSTGGLLAGLLERIRPSAEDQARHAARQVPLSDLLHQLGVLGLHRVANVAGAPGDVQELAMRPPQFLNDWPGWVAHQQQQQQPPLQEWNPVGTERLKSTMPTSGDLLRAFDQYVRPGFLPQNYLNFPASRGN